MGLPLLAFLVVLLGPAAAVGAAPLDLQGLGLPLDCLLGETCWLVNYVDTDPSTQARDFRCGPRTYNGHDGTDFAIRDLGVMAKGVSVVASAPGLVMSVRDGVADAALTGAASRARVKGKACGNGVVLDHGEGGETQYCHLRRGSITVKVGERVEAGARLGLVGLSGQTEFPHVHLAVRRDGRAVDPFTGRGAASGCGQEGQALWGAGLFLPYEEVVLYHAGFAADRPDPAAIRKGEGLDGLLSASAPALVFWVDIFGVEAGDRLRFQITGPDGKPVLEEEQPIEKTQARRFAYVGKRLKAETWPSGSYTGRVTLTRSAEGGELSREVVRTVTVR